MGGLEEDRGGYRDVRANGEWKRGVKTRAESSEKNSPSSRSNGS